jgi:hypothetical protein
LRLQPCDELREPLLERLAFLLDFFGTHVASRRQDVLVRSDFVELGAFAEARYVLVLAGALVATPGMVRAGDTRDVVIGELALGAVDHPPELASVDEQHLAAPVTESVVLLVAGQEPEADRDLRRVEELAGEGDHAVHEVGLDDGLPDLALAGLVRGHRTVGEDEAGLAGRRQVVDEVLHPGEVRVARGRRAVLPADVVGEPVAAPVAVVERRVREDVVGLQVLVQVAVERVGMLGPEVRLDPADREFIFASRHVVSFDSWP